jgi:hypothetical protein
MGVENSVFNFKYLCWGASKALNTFLKQGLQQQNGGHNK